MTTISRRLLLPGLTALTLAACTATGGGLASGSPAASPPPASTSPGGAGSEPNPGSGGTISPPASGEPSVPAPVPTIVVPKPGRLDVHPVGATAIEARVDGRHVTVKLTWWSGVEPSGVLAFGLAPAARSSLRASGPRSSKIGFISLHPV